MRLIAGWDGAIPLMAIAFLAAGAATLLLTPLVRRLAHRYDVMDRPDHRRVNASPVPRGGGLAIATTFVVVVAAVTLANERLKVIPMPDSIGWTELTALLGGGAAAALVGAADDYYQLRARWQFLGQLALALVAIVIGISVDFVANPFGPGLLFLRDFAGAFTVFWILGMINTINWIDGLDGLSSGVGLIAAVTLGVISLTVAVGQPYVAVLCFALAGALLGFLRWNFHPATIFMGTSGTMFVGYTLAVLSILGTAKVAVAMLVLGVPIIDTFWIIVRRVAAGRSPFTPDRGHIHHRLLDLGLSHTQTVVLIYGLCACLAILAFVLSGTAQLYAFAVFVIVSGLVFYSLSRRAGRPGSGPKTEGRRETQAASVETRTSVEGGVVAELANRR
jgi:UDP-GlcNAc:undecaprenyl-phosphate GlcNAc-1-phosphate transferase